MTAPEVLRQGHGEIALIFAMGVAHNRRRGGAHAIHAVSRGPQRERETNEVRRGCEDFRKLDNEHLPEARSP